MQPRRSQPGSEAITAPELSRVERRKKNTRRRILAAAEQLMRSRPVDSVTIQDITAAADVGHGSFYLHFKTKYDVLVPIVQAMAARTDGQLRQILAGTDDPALVIAVSARVVGRQIVGDELWRWLLQHSGVPVEELRRAVGTYVERDFRTGFASGRISAPDPMVVATYAFGGFVNCVLAAMNHDRPEEQIDQGVELTLRVFGLTPEEARQLAHQPLPELELES
ncbi:MAG: TetR/AcrR family transcriptional regulator [Pseudomonadales bacterium]